MGSHSAVKTAARSLVIDTAGDVLAVSLWAGSRRDRLVTAKTRGGRDRSVKAIRLAARALGFGLRPAVVAVAAGATTPAGARLGAVLGNAISYSLGVPVCEAEYVNGSAPKLGPKLSPGQLRPRYPHPPHLTLPRSG